MQKKMVLIYIRNVSEFSFSLSSRFMQLQKRKERTVTPNKSTNIYRTIQNIQSMYEQYYMQRERNCRLNLKTHRVINVRFNPSSFLCVMYQNRKKWRNLFNIFYGILKCNGTFEGLYRDLKKLRRYSRVPLVYL